MLLYLALVIVQTVDLVLRLLLLRLQRKHLLCRLGQQCSLRIKQCLQLLVNRMLCIRQSQKHTLASLSAVRRAAASVIHDFFCSRKSCNFFCSSVFQSAYRSLVDEALALCVRNSSSSWATCER